METMTESDLQNPNTPPPPKTLRDLGLESWEPLTVHRSQLLNAPYNPRLISEAGKRKLRAELKKHGHVAGITWNKRTGHICGGHQRMAATDALAGTSDYTLTVSAIDVDQAREKEINIALNNEEAGGDWDLDKLSGLLKDKELSLEGMGFDHADLFRMFGDTPILERNENLDLLAAKVREARDRYNAIESKNQDKGSDEFYFVVVGRSPEQVTAFFKLAGVENSRYQSLEELARICGLLEAIRET